VPNSKLFASLFAIRSTSGSQRKTYSKAVQPQQLTADAGSLTRPRSLHLQRHVSQVTAIARYATHAAEPRDDDAELPTSPPFSSGKYENLTIGIPKESYPGERRVAITPQNVALLLKKGFSRVLIERGAGVEAQFTDEAYEQAGAKTVDRRNVFAESDIMLKVRALSTEGAESEVDAIRDGATVISFLYPMQNKAVVERIASRKATAFAMDMIPRISRAQVFDALRCVKSVLRCLRRTDRYEFHGEYCWVQGCLGSFKHLWPLSYWSSHGGWKGDLSDIGYSGRS
jgi:NAD(P) transhydrogenase